MMHVMHVPLLNVVIVLSPSELLFVGLREYMGSCEPQHVIVGPPFGPTAHWNPIYIMADDRVLQTNILKLDITLPSRNTKSCQNLKIPKTSLI